MKKLLVLLVLVMMFVMVGCGNNNLRFGKDLVKVGNELSAEFGIPIVNKRVKKVS